MHRGFVVFIICGAFGACVALACGWRLEAVLLASTSVCLLVVRLALPSVARLAGYEGPDFVCAGVHRDGRRQGTRRPDPHILKILRDRGRRMP